MGFPIRTLEEVRLAVGNGARMLIRRSVPESVNDTVSHGAADAVIVYTESGAGLRRTPSRSPIATEIQLEK